MEDKLKQIEELAAAAANAFHIVKPSRHPKGKGSVSIPIGSYAELSWYIIDVIKVSVAALEANNEGVGNVRNVPSAVSGVLEKIIEVIPLEEMDLLDKIYSLLAEDDAQ